ncbi:hypothetical protein CerSpe_239790 [Prunus speciosa]
MSLQSREDDENIIVSNTPGNKLYSLEDPEGQARRPPVSNKNGELSTKNKWESKLLSASFWNKMIVISCVIAISLDPLFFYIPFIDEDKKCLGMDKKLRNVALILRSLTDITFLVHIGYQIWEALNKAYKGINKGKSEWQLDWQPTLIRKDEIIPFAVTFAGKLSWGSLLIDLLSVFPMPQLLVLKVLYKMKIKEKGYLERRKVVIVFLLIQYWARIGRIILSSKKLTRTTGIRVKALFNLFLYILASHDIGAFWHFFSIQREISCWHHACQNNTKHEECKTTLYCYDRNTSTPNITFLDEHCKINVPYNATTPFDYGMFLDSLKSGNAGNNSTFPTKLAYSFWWGLRNLSSFGTNLTTSSYVWENLFAIHISITGLLLFIYLIGNVQTFIQMKTTKSSVIRKKIKLKEQDIEAWMAKNCIPDDMKKEIMKNINKKLEEDKDADLENLFNVLPWYTKKCLKRVLCFNVLSKVELLQLMNESVLKMMCDYLTPVTYPKDKVIFRRGDPMDRMLVIIEGVLLTYSTTPDPSLTHGGETTEDSGSTTTKQVKKDEVYGEELLTWASASPSESGRFKNLPTCPENVRCQTKVEGFALAAKDLTSVASKCRRWWKIKQ